MVKKQKNYEIRTDIYSFQGNLEREIRKIEASNLSDRNKKLLKDHADSYRLRGSGQNRIVKVCRQMRKLGLMTDKNLDQLEIEDLTRLVNTININPHLSPATKSDYRRILRSFYKWLKGADERLDSTDLQIKKRAERFYEYIDYHIKRAYKLEGKNSSLIITKEDCQLLLKHCQYPLDRVVISLLHSTGMRVGELLYIRIRDLHFTDKYLKIRVNGKTGERIIPNLEAIPYIMQWLEHHPDPENPDALLIISANNRYRWKPLKYIGIVRILQRVAKASNFSKPYNCHWFRHSRASIWSNDFNEQQLTRLMGWVMGSDQARTYVHMTNADVINAFETQNNLKKQEDKKPTTTECACGTINDTSARYCYKCGKPLTVAIALDDETIKKETTNEAFTLLSTIILANPKLKQKFERLQKDHALLGKVTI